MMMMILTMTLMMVVMEVNTMGGGGINLSPILAKLHTRPHLGP